MGWNSWPSHFMRRDVAVPAHNAVRQCKTILPCVSRFRFCVYEQPSFWLNEPGKPCPPRFAADIAAARLNCSDAAAGSPRARRRLGEQQQKLFLVIPSRSASSFVSHVRYSLMIAAFSAEVVNRRLLLDRRPGPACSECKAFQGRYRSRCQSLFRCRRRTAAIACESISGRPRPNLTAPFGSLTFLMMILLFRSAY